MASSGQLVTCLSLLADGGEFLVRQRAGAAVFAAMGINSHPGSGSSSDLDRSASMIQANWRGKSLRSMV